MKLLAELRACPVAINTNTISIACERGRPTRLSGDHSRELNVADPPPPPLMHCARDTRTLKQYSFNFGQRWTLDQ